MGRNDQNQCQKNWSQLTWQLSPLRRRQRQSRRLPAPVIAATRRASPAGRIQRRAVLMVLYLQLTYHLYCGVMLALGILAVYQSYLMCGNTATCRGEGLASAAAGKRHNRYRFVSRGYTRLVFCGLQLLQYCLLLCCCLELGPQTSLL